MASNTIAIDLRPVAQALQLSVRQVESVVELLDAGNTVPFLTRYRKDQTGGLDEEQIRGIESRLIKMRLLADRKQTILRSIESQGKLTPELAAEIEAAASRDRTEPLIRYRGRVRRRHDCSGGCRCAARGQAAKGVEHPVDEVPAPHDAVYRLCPHLRGACERSCSARRPSTRSG